MMFLNEANDDRWKTLSSRFDSAEGHLKAFPKSEVKNRPDYGKPSMETMQIRMIDLNLFRVFDALMLHCSVRKASQILSVTPSAVSHALSRLRQSIGDELFVRSESGMQPTRRALELASDVREGLEKLESALRGKESVPAEVLRTFYIAATDYACMVILPSLVKRLAKSAPAVDLRVSASNRLGVVRQLEKGWADLAIGWFNKLPTGIRRSTFLREDEVIAVRTGHPLTRGRLTKERLAEFPHVVVEMTEIGNNETDRFVDNRKVARGVSIGRALHEFQEAKRARVSPAAVCVPHFGSFAPLLQSSNMIAMLPRRLALWAAVQAPLALLDLPYTSMTINIEMLWNESADQDQGLQWLVNELAGSVRQKEALNSRSKTRCRLS
ncbi:MAG TPA: LysR family transcriptional regulator [Chthoniobacterales bacterium]|nr:LysR family transcriptional regulator [Chthoniobacterales bacterium]